MKTIIYILALALLAVSVSAGSFPPPVDYVGTDTTYGSYDWVVCRADESSAWVAAATNQGGVYSPNNVCEVLGYEEADAWGGNCGTVCGYCGESGNEYYGWGGGDADYLTRTVHWRCVGQGEIIDDPGNEVPEFGLIAGALVAVTAGLFIYKKRR